jgi:hypothetical protein
MYAAILHFTVPARHRLEEVKSVTPCECDPLAAFEFPAA